MQSILDIVLIAFKLVDRYQIIFEKKKVVTAIK